MTRQNGFTLIELLVALVAGSLVIVTLSWSLSALTRQYATSNEELLAAKRAAVAPILVAMLEQAQPPGRDPSRFRGDEKRLAAIVPPPMAAGPVGPLKLTLTVRRDGEGEGLYAQLQPAIDDAPFPAAAQDERLLITGYRDIAFTYLPPEETQVSSLPRLITLTLTDRQGRIHRILAEPRIDSDGSCHFDPISMTCRY